MLEGNPVPDLCREGVRDECGAPEVRTATADRAGGREIQMNRDGIVPSPIRMGRVRVVVARDNALVGKGDTGSVGELGGRIGVAARTRPAPQLRDRHREQPLPVGARHRGRGGILVPPGDAIDLDSRS